MLPWLLLAAPMAVADVFTSGDFHLRAGTEPGTYELTARLPAFPVPEPNVHWPAGCVQTALERRTTGNRVNYRYSFRCDGPPGVAAVIDTAWPVDGGRLTLDLGNGRPTTIAITGNQRGTTPGIDLPLIPHSDAARPWHEVLARMTRQGIEHIARGWDHLAFVLCLCMSTAGWRLLWLVTAFTLGHSVALAAAMLGLVRLPLPPTEALIALSIVFVARDGLLSPAGGGSVRPWQPVAVVLTFGLVHGLGFAGSMAQIGTTQAEFVPALIGFNLGVELGQLLFIALVLASMALLRSCAVDVEARRGALYAAGIAGGFWLVERLAAFG